jgi:phosphoglycerol geranylgeranyltransferase
MSVYQSLLKNVRDRGAGYLVLIDPDKLPPEQMPKFVQAAHAAGVDGLLVGGSLLFADKFGEYIGQLKKLSDPLPVILFPGSLQQITAAADAILFLSLISGRDASNLIGNQVLGAPLVYRSGLEAISTAYMLVDSGSLTSAQFMSNSIPLPRNKPDIAVAHALAAMYLGFKMIYLEAGSGADLSVPEEMIHAVSKTVEVPLIVGGGIRTPEDAARKVAAGASFVVTGNVLEKEDNAELLKAFAEAIHNS